MSHLLKTAIAIPTTGTLAEVHCGLEVRAAAYLTRPVGILNFDQIIRHAIGDANLGYSA